PRRTDEPPADRDGGDAILHSRACDPVRKDLQRWLGLSGWLKFRRIDRFIYSWLVCLSQLRKSKHRTQAYYNLRTGVFLGVVCRWNRNWTDIQAHSLGCT